MSAFKAWQENWSPAARESEQHNELLARLVACQNTLSDAAGQTEADQKTIALLERARIDELGNVGVVVMPDDPDYDPQAPPRILSDADIKELIAQGNAFISRSEYGTGA